MPTDVVVFTQHLRQTLACVIAANSIFLHSFHVKFHLLPSFNVQYEVRS